MFKEGEKLMHRRNRSWREEWEYVTATALQTPHEEGGRWCSRYQSPCSAIGHCVVCIQKRNADSWLMPLLTTAEL